MDEIDRVDLWQACTTYEALLAAWCWVKANGGSAGGDLVKLGEFEQNLFANLTELRADVLSGVYRSGPVRKVSIPKKKPGYRILNIPPIRDRVLHTSIATALTPIFEKLFEDGSFAYRPGRGVVHAVERIEKWHRRGYNIVIEADIVSYFDNINHEILLDKIRDVIVELPGGATLLVQVERILAEQGQILQTPGTGLLQGSPMSPLLANLFLDALDEEIEAQGVKIVRFADDFVILCKSIKKAEKVLAHCVSVLAAHNLRLHDEGTRIVNFDKGFDFIGYLFLRSMAIKEKTKPDQLADKRPVKSEVTDEGIITLGDEESHFDPGKRVLYVLDPKHILNIRNRSFSVTREDGAELIAIPYKRIGRIELGPQVDFRRSIIDLALLGNINIALLDGVGQTKGMLCGPEQRKATLHLNQAAGVLDGTFRVSIAKSLVDARIRNQRTQLQRLNRRRQIEDVNRTLAEAKRLYRKVECQNTVEELRGLEGAAAAQYWRAIGLMFGNQSNEKFLRTRPAKTSQNAVLNYLCGILERDIRAAIQSVGLHPGFGFLHASKNNHEGLVYDLMEPFRAPLTEGLTVYLFSSKKLKPDMFIEQEGAIIEISQEARHAIVSGYEAAVAKRVNARDCKTKLGWRAMMRHQAQTLANALNDKSSAAFLPYLMEA